MLWLPRAVALIVLLLGAVPCAAQTAPDFTVVTLGTGSPPPVMTRFGPATLVKAGTQTLLFDAGRGATQRLWQTRTKLGAIDALFVTHLHSDHVVGIPDLWLTGWLTSPYGQRGAPMKVFGPQGTAAMMTGLAAAYKWDVDTRIADQDLPAAGAMIDTTEVKEGVVYEQGGVKVTAFLVDHGDLIKPCFGYRVDYDGRSVTISGDTRFSENLIKHATGTSLLIHQVAAMKDELVQKSPGYKAIYDHHTKPEEAGTVFTRAAPRLAVFYHLVLLGDLGIAAPNEAEVVARARTTYQGPLVVAEDLMAFTITRDAVSVTPPR
jgi:ribonuclease Z